MTDQMPNPFAPPVVRLATTKDFARDTAHAAMVAQRATHAEIEAELRAQRDDLADQLAKAMSENANLALQNVALHASLKRADHAKAALTASEDRYRDLVLRAQKAEAHAAMLAAQVDEQADQIETGTADRAAAAAKAADIVHRDKDGYYNVDDLIAIAAYIEKGKP